MPNVRIHKEGSMMGSLPGSRRRFAAGGRVAVLAAVLVFAPQDVFQMRALAVQQLLSCEASDTQPNQVSGLLRQVH
jgi:hypothetical protein